MPDRCINGYDESGQPAFICVVPEDHTDHELAQIMGLPEGPPLSKNSYPLTAMEAVVILCSAGITALPINLRYALEDDWS
jgi:hypothetical protein